MEGKIIYPLDRANFREIREEGFLYVDKTLYIDRLIQSKGKYFFLARPRRFGKSLFLDTLAEYFKGNQELFKGLQIDNLRTTTWNSYPVLRFSMGGNSFLTEEALSAHLFYQIKENGKAYKIETSETDISNLFNELIREITQKTGKKVVILIDEYDAPLSASIDKPALQQTFRDQLYGFYSVLKEEEKNIHFCMLTGVTRYGKVSVFSGLNNLNDITFDNEYAGICGITEEELVKYYRKGLELLAQKEEVTIEEITSLLKFHYDGYHFSESMLDIYNPFSINYAFDKGKMEDFWCRSGVPTLLSKTLMNNDYDVSKLNGKRVDQNALVNLSMHGVEPVPLFYQTGYLTLKHYDERRRLYTLGYPNREVENGILNNILGFYVSGKRFDSAFVFDLEDALEEGNPEEFVRLLSSFLADIPLDLRQHVKRYENYYHTVFYCIVKLIGLNVHAEYATSEGYIDILIKTDKYIYVIELKVNGTAEEAIRQIEKKHYVAPFIMDGRKIYKIGLGFSKESGTLVSSIIE